MIFKLSLVTDGWCVSCEIALRWISLDLTADKSTLVQVMAWCHEATSHYLSQCWPISMSPYDVTRPQWVKGEKFSEYIKGKPSQISGSICHPWCSSSGSIISPWDWLLIYQHEKWVDTVVALFNSLTFTQHQEFTLCLALLCLLMPWLWCSQGISCMILQQLNTQWVILLNTNTFILTF